MFTNIGGKIKTLATVICWLGIIASIIAGLISFSSVVHTGDEVIIIGLLIMAAGSLLSWLGSMTLYGFGQLIERTEEIAENTRCLRNAPAQQAAPVIDPATRDKMETLQALLNQGLISEEEYFAKLSELKY